MSQAQYKRDMAYLAGALAHRGPNTESEHAAALYMAGRFKEHTRDTEVDEFHSIEGHWLLFASYYAEFLIVSVIAFWWPFPAFAYGLAVFMAYLAEFTGYRVFARLMPQYATQNVVARFIAPNPRRLFIVSAHCDSPMSGPLQDPRVLRLARTGCFVLVVAMVVVLVSCAAQGFRLFDDSTRVDLIIRWVAVACLLSGSAFLLYCEVKSEYGRGAADNASGLAVLLRLAERFGEEPLDDADVWFVATGSKEAGLNGMRRLVKSHEFDKDTTYFLNVDNVGAGGLRYVTSEGMLYSFASSREMVEACRAVADSFGATPVKSRGLPSDALIPLARGFNALTITTADENVESEGILCDDSHMDIDYTTLETAAGFAEAALRGLDSRLGGGGSAGM